MNRIQVEVLRGPPRESAVEVVERKGIGHPDTICDGVAEAASLALTGEYLKQFGVVLHHNLDKGLLAAGRAEHRFGGGRILRPMRLVFGDRATFRAAGREVDVEGIVVRAAKAWLKRNLRFVDPERHVRYQSEIKPGSAELRDLFERGARVMPANDSSAAVGYAPLSVLERLVLETERHLNSPRFKRTFPESGEDVKVLGVRRGAAFELTISMPLIERYVSSDVEYFHAKAEVFEALARFLQTHEPRADFRLNTLDAPGRGVSGCYTSVVGTSAEDGDSGQVGRGNRVSGVIALGRPSGTEAAAGKNPVSHPGKVYTLLAHQAAHHIQEEVEGVAECYVWLASHIGQPLDEPALASVQLVLKRGAEARRAKRAARELFGESLANLPRFIQRLERGAVPVV